MRRIIKYGENDYGIYVTGTRGPLGTPLQFRGTWDAVQNIDIEIHLRDCVLLRSTATGYKPVLREERGLGLMH